MRGNQIEGREVRRQCSVGPTVISLVACLSESVGEQKRSGTGSVAIQPRPAHKRLCRGGKKGQHAASKVRSLQFKAWRSQPRRHAP
eukprot:1073453-Karenia_brevis.AAC.1